MENRADPEPSPSLELTSEQAIAWLRSVDGELYRTPTQSSVRAGLWVAVVRTPSFSGQRARMIIAVGDTALEAAHAAACQWHAAWEGAPQGH